MRFSTVEFASVRVTDYMVWTFLEIRDGQGAPAVVEITFLEDIAEVVRLISELVASLQGKDIASESDLGELLGINTDELRANRALATAFGALGTAVVDIQSQVDGSTITEALGGKPQENVQLYANINRSLVGKERTPRAFAAAAEGAVKAGFAIVKCAPFDEVHPPATTDEILDLARPGLERVAAVRLAVGPDVPVLVDCHSRFEAHTAPSIAEQLGELDVGWFEEPLDPISDAEGLALAAEKVTIPVAGGEFGYGEQFFVDLVRRGAVSIVMPDVRHCGGVAEAHRAGRSTIRAGGQVSLHSPTRPISQLASAHVTAALPGALALEHAIGEVPWRADLVVPAERIENGHIWFPGTVGLGATLNSALVARYGRRWNG